MVDLFSLPMAEKLENGYTFYLSYQLHQEQYFNHHLQKAVSHVMKDRKRKRTKLTYAVEMKKWDMKEFVCKINRINLKSETFLESHVSRWSREQDSCEYLIESILTNSFSFSAVSAQEWDRRFFVTLLHVSQSLKSGKGLFAVRKSPKKSVIAFQYDDDADSEWKQFPRPQILVEKNCRGVISVDGKAEEELPIFHLLPGEGMLKTVLFYTLLGIAPSADDYKFIHFVEKVVIGTEYHNFSKSIVDEINSILSPPKKVLQPKAVQPAVIEKYIFGPSTSTRSTKRPATLDGFVTAFKTPK